MEGESLESGGGDDASLYMAEGRAEQLKPTQTPYQTRRAVMVVTGPLHRMWRLTGSQIAYSMVRIMTRE